MVHIDSSIGVNVDEVDNMDLTSLDSEELIKSSMETRVTTSKTEKEEKDDIDPYTTEQMLAYEDTLKNYMRFGFVFGYKPIYNWEPTEQTPFHISCALLASAWVGLGYTMFFHINNGNYSRVMEPLAIFGMSASCLMKWLCQMTYYRQMYSLIFFPKVLCLHNTVGPRADIMKDEMKRTVKFLHLFLVGIVTALSILVLFPIYSYVIKNEKIPIMPIEFPFVNQTKMTEFLLAQVLMIFIGVYGNFGTVMFGSGFLICVYNYSFQVKMIALDFKELDEMWLNPKTTTQHYRYSYLMNMCLKVQDMNSYMSFVKQCFELKFFLYFFINYFAQVVCLYEITVDDWKGGLTITFVVFLEMLFYCFVGTRLSTEGENMCDIIYCCKWYLYDLRSQRLIQLLLHDQQQPKVIMLGTLGPLNLVTLVTITKSMYSMYTVIVETM